MPTRDSSNKILIDLVPCFASRHAIVLNCLRNTEKRVNNDDCLLTFFQHGNVLIQAGLISFK